ncbi:hypothetical protein BAE44_0020432 [Dichanthelium oligosanthes]|uniref:Uncharacterized protein n=1 Tax=Dichanthelium oligosanthes TaxID=888268 RepID=A0A1E5V091_9POAL|nr:hypothetical protein BAE44_0020432 [Dichanthelium oligosanthes]
MMGSRFKDRVAFFRLLEQGLKLFSNPSFPELYPSSRLTMFISRTPSLMKKQCVEMMAFMETIIQEHQVRRGDNVDDEEEDLVDVLLRIHRDSELQFPISMDSIKAVVTAKATLAQIDVQDHINWTNCNRARKNNMIRVMIKLAVVV